MVFNKAEDMNGFHTIVLGEKKIGKGYPCFIIAEIGANFHSMEEAQEMIRAAAEAKADAVKIQTFKAETLVSPGAMFTLEDGSRVSQYDFFKALEVSDEVHAKLKLFAEELGLIFFSTPSAPEDADLLEKLLVPAFKTGSDDLTNYPFLEYIAKKGKPMIVSTGMSTLEEVGKAAESIRKTGNEQVVFLHCAVGYPANPATLNLLSMVQMREKLGVQVGFSDHSLGITAPVAAVVLGAEALEKHLTLDRSKGGPDNDVALEPKEFVEMVKAVREAEQMLGDGQKRVMPQEEKWREAARKSIVAKIDIPEGAHIIEAMLAFRRPAGGLEPAHWNEIIGKTAKRSLRAGEYIVFEDIS